VNASLRAVKVDPATLFRPSPSKNPSFSRDRMPIAISAISINVETPNPR
jgi:hypothetical protein